MTRGEMVIRLLSAVVPARERARFVEEWDSILRAGPSARLTVGLCFAAARVAGYRAGAVSRRSGVARRWAGLLLHGAVVGVLLTVTDVPAWVPFLLVLGPSLPIAAARRALRPARA